MDEEYDALHVKYMKEGGLLRLLLGSPGSRSREPGAPMQECLHARTVPMKKAEIYMATFWAGLSIAVVMEMPVIPGTKQPIGWARGVGTQSGWFPFYLALIMLLCSLVVLIPEACSSGKGRPGGQALCQHGWSEGCSPGIRPHARLRLHPAVARVLPRVHALSRICLRFVGKHSWTLSLATGILFSAAIFTIFEKYLLLTLAKGVLEPILNKLL